MADDKQHPLEKAIEKFKRKRTGPGKRKGRMGQVVHREGLKWLERHYLSLPEEEKERLRNLFDTLPERDVNSKLESPANEGKTPCEK
jgi:hypothetical protein